MKLTLQERVRKVLDKRPDLSQFNDHQATTGIQMGYFPNEKHPVLLAIVKEWRQDRISSRDVSPTNEQFRTVVLN